MRHSTKLVQIQTGQSLSDEFRVEEGRIAAIRLPSDWEGNANLTFQGNDDQGGYFDVYDGSGMEFILVAAVSRHVIVPRGPLDGIRTLRIRSGTKDIPVTQSGLRTLVVHVAVGG